MINYLLTRLDRNNRSVYASPLHCVS